jgi:hypothetical protein
LGEGEFVGEGGFEAVGGCAVGVGVFLGVGSEEAEVDALIECISVLILGRMR